MYVYIDICNIKRVDMYTYVFVIIMFNSLVMSHVRSTVTTHAMPDHMPINTKFSMHVHKYIHTYSYIGKLLHKYAKCFD